MPASSVVQNSSHQVLEEIWISSTPFMVKKQMNHQDSVTANLQNINSNKGPLLPKPFMWFQLSWGYLITMPLVMMMLRFTLHSLQLNLTLNQFQIQTPLLLNQLMEMKWTISWNSSTRNWMKIFSMLTSILFRIDWWLPLFQYFIQSLLCCFINMGELMLQSQIVYHTFLCLPQPSPLWNWLM